MQLFCRPSFEPLEQLCPAFLAERHEVQKFSDLAHETAAALYRFRVQILDTILRIQPGERVNCFSKRPILEHDGPDLFFVGVTCQLLKLQRLVIRQAAVTEPLRIFPGTKHPLNIQPGADYALLPA